MYAAAHTSLALAAKRTNPTASLFGLMVAAQATELLWVGLTYAGIEHPTVDAHGDLHLEYLPYSHSLLVGLGIGVLLWAAMRWVFRRLHRGGLRLGRCEPHRARRHPARAEHPPRPLAAHPTIGFNLQASPWLDFAVETAFSVACWAYYRPHGRDRRRPDDGRTATWGTTCPRCSTADATRAGPCFPRTACEH